MKKEIEVRLELSEGYEQRFTAACIEILKRRDMKKKEIANEDQREYHYSA